MRYKLIGSGTTAIAARKLGRRWIGSEISQEYADQATERIERETSLPLLDPILRPQLATRSTRGILEMPSCGLSDGRVVIVLGVMESPEKKFR